MTLVFELATVRRIWSLAEWPSGPPRGRGHAHVLQKSERLDRLTGHRFGTEVHLDTGDDPRVHQDGCDCLTAGGVLSDRLVTQDDTADAVAKAGRGDDQLAVGATVVLGLGDPEPGKSLIAGGD